ncbi:MAG TPA: carnitine 3-dehydrogenase [Candidatus Dormibacteraeota bacterium]|nr:carnitine 3-dehydrogenase [Candidatus Dormibacteraeota bacterium]
MAEPTLGLPKTVGLLGGGVIGAGWAARFLMWGIDVRLYDPDPQTERKVAEVLENSRRAWRNLTMIPIPPEGRLTLAVTPEQAVEGADFVQESAPEREDLKRELLARASRVAGPKVVFGSSTSGLLPSQLQLNMEHPERLVIGHPFNPVYLLPLVEVCGGKLTSAGAIERAETVYRAVGMSPLRVRKEIPGFIADRLLEALWREALWLIKDDVATASEIDDAIRLGPGLRWSIMGTFLIYRMAGGEAGMRHFMAQFGPTLQWPWSKLTDVPDLDEALLERIVAQSDEQAGGESVRDLERFRDDCLVAVLQGLRSHDAGAGAVLAAHERALFEVAHGREMLDGDDLSRPLRLHSQRIPPEWVDYNGHVGESRYLQVLADASDALFRYLGVDSAYLASGCSYFTAETHLSFLRQTHAEDVVEVSTQVLAGDEKRLHLYHRLERPQDSALLAESETMLLHVDTELGTVVPAGAGVAEHIRRVAEAHSHLPRPERAGRRIGDRGA